MCLCFLNNSQIGRVARVSVNLRTRSRGERRYGELVEVKITEQYVYTFVCLCSKKEGFFRWTSHSRETFFFLTFMKSQVSFYILQALTREGKLYDIHSPQKTIHFRYDNDD